MLMIELLFFGGLHTQLYEKAHKPCVEERDCKYLAIHSAASLKILINT